MAGKLITAEEAAKILGVSPAEVAEMRQRQDLYGYRDGSNWKFKEDDVLRVAGDRSGSGATQSFDLSGSGINLGSDEIVLGGSSPAMGSGDADLDFSGSGLNLMGDSGLVLKQPTAANPRPPKSGRDDESTGGFPVMNPPGGASGSGSGILGGSESGLDLLGSDVRLASLSSPGSSNILNEPLPSGIGNASDAGKTILTAELAGKPIDSSIKLSVRENDSVLSDPGSDVSLDVAGSGINLLAPKDSGILLDNLDLSAASGVLKRGGSDIKKDEDFLLTPTEERGDQDTDSGSQVIALDENLGEDATATLLAGDVPGLGGVLEDAGLGGAYGAAGMMPGGMAGGQPTAPDTVFGMGSVVTLAVSALFMAVTGAMMYDIIRNMWSWDTPLSFNSSIMDAMLGRGN